MSDERFFDTNVLVYAFDETEKDKHPAAKKLVQDILNGHASGVISNQILGECFSVLTTKLRHPLQKEEAKTIVNSFIDSMHWRKINYTALTVSKAMKRSSENGTPIWDALITETMVENGVYMLLTEDVEGFKDCPVRVVNPFKPTPQQPTDPK